MRIEAETHKIPAGGSSAGQDGLRGRIDYVQYTRPGVPYDNGATLAVTVRHADGVHSFSVLSGVSLDADFLFCCWTAQESWSCRGVQNRRLSLSRWRRLLASTTKVCAPASR